MHGNLRLAVGDEIRTAHGTSVVVGLYVRRGDPPVLVAKLADQRGATPPAEVPIRTIRQIVACGEAEVASAASVGEMAA